MNVNFYVTYRQVVGAKSIEMNLSDAATIQSLVDAIILQYPLLKTHLVDDSGRLLSHVHIFINGRDSQLLADGPATPLSASDKIDIFPPVAGG